MDFTEGFTYSSGLLNSDGKKIDQKFDDGSPLRGKILAPLCTIDWADVEATYDEYSAAPITEFNSTYLLSDTTTRKCTMHFILSI